MLPSENNAHRTSHKIYFLPTAEIKDYSVMIDVRNFFDLPIRNDIIDINDTAISCVNDIFTQLVAYLILPLFKKIIS